MLRIDMHMHPWSHSGRALILHGLCATLASCLVHEGVVSVSQLISRSSACFTAS